MQSAVPSKKTVLFLDINMPGLNGWQVLAQLEQLPKALRKHLDVYILTTSPNVRDEYRASRSPLVKCYLQKPLSKHLHSIFAGQSLQLSVA
jgi:CheY-like chemotaxis protein